MKNERHYKKRTEEALKACLSSEKASPMLQEAMYYSVLSGGKRLRPLLIYHFGEALAIPLTKLDAPACALELIHAYSLIHDDLPAMDNDDWRRGKPACHKMYGEAIALLTGDALQALAFECLLKTPVPAAQILVMMEVFAKAIGAQGMVGGQALEFDRTISSHEEPWPMTINTLKTGALFQVALEWVAIIAEVDRSVRLRLAHWGVRLGGLYQLQDDLCDKVMDPQKLSGLQQRLQQGIFQAEASLRQLFPDIDWLLIHAFLLRLFPEAKKTLIPVS